MATHAARTTRAASRTNSETRPEPTPLPPTPHLEESQLEPSIGDLYKLLQHLYTKVSRVEDTIRNIENVVLDHEDKITAGTAVGRGTQEMLIRIEGLLTGQVEGFKLPTISTPPQAHRPDVDQTPRAEAPSGPSRARAHFSVESRSRSRDVKPLGSAFGASITDPYQFGRQTSPLRTSTPPPPPPAPRSTTTPFRFGTPGTVIPKIKEPDAFDGTKGKIAEQWSARVGIWAKSIAPTFPDEESLILHIFGMTKGKAADWAQPHIIRLAKNDPSAIRTLNAFNDEFTAAFGDPDAKRRAARQIGELTQTSDAHTYTTEFETLESELNWGEEAFRAAYERGLHWKVKETLSQMYPIPATLAEVKTHAKRIDAIRRENESTRPPRTNKPKPSSSSNPATTTKPTTMTTTSTREKLSESANFVSPEERQARRDAGLCVKCGSPDHIFRACTNGWSKERVPGKGKKRDETAKIAEVPTKESDSEKE